MILRSSIVPPLECCMVCLCDAEDTIREYIVLGQPCPTRLMRGHCCQGSKMYWRSTSGAQSTSARL
jgi:hypothetical protein